jgi:transglutaminase-like putative cysteine protease
MATMARTQGIPARLVTGYFPISGQRDDQGFFVLREADAHAWAELYFEGVGWVPFDPTEGAESVSGGERGTPTLAMSLFEQPAFRMAVWTMIGLVAIAGATFGLSALLSHRRYLRQERVALARAYAEFTDLLARSTGRPRRFYETPAEYIGALAEALGPSLPAVEAVNEKFEIAFYANGRPDKPTASELQASIRSLRSELKPRRRAAP